MTRDLLENESRVRMTVTVEIISDCVDEARTLLEDLLRSDPDVADVYVGLPRVVGS